MNHCLGIIIFITHSNLVLPYNPAVFMRCFEAYSSAVVSRKPSRKKESIDGCYFKRLLGQALGFVLHGDFGRVEELQQDRRAGSYNMYVCEGGRERQLAREEQSCRTMRESCIGWWCMLLCVQARSWLVTCSRSSLSLANKLCSVGVAATTNGFLLFYTLWGTKCPTVFNQLTLFTAYSPLNGLLIPLILSKSPPA